MSDNNHEIKNSPDSNTSDVQIKEEPKENDIKDYAEHTMNELLGWYGYDKVNSTDTEHLNLEKYTSGDKEGAPSSADDLSRDGSFDSDDNASEGSEISKLSRSDCQNSLAAQHRNLVTALTKKHRLTGAPEGTIPSEKIVCGWCQNTGPKHFTLKTPSETKYFCSEVCFTQCRRASFKKNKICDWCKHVRHTVNYVDFQDGEQQLQFCSAKCLNQYKMSIFCRETQEHLKQIRSPSEVKKSKSSNGEQILITPELWLKDGKMDSKDKESKPPILEKETDVKNRIPKIEKIENECSNRERSSINSKLISERMSRERYKRSTPKDNKGSTPTPSVQESQNSNPQQMLTPPGNMPALSQMIPPQLWSMFAPGMPQFGGVPPWFYPGFMPPVPGFVPPGYNFESINRGHNEQPVQNGQLPPVSPVLSEDSDMQDGRRSTTGNRHRPTKTSNFDNRTRSLNPEIIENGERFMNSNINGQSQGSGMPPVTMIMPVPIALPFPVPIPLPLPLTMEKIMEVFNKKKPSEPTPKSTVPNPNQYVSHDKDNLNTSLSSDGLDSSMSSGHVPVFQKPMNDINENETIPAGRLSCNSCLTEKSVSPDLGSDRSSPQYESRLSYDYSMMRKRALSPDGSLDLTKKSRNIDTNNCSNSCDGAIDLSKDSTVGRINVGKENREMNDSSSIQSDTELQNGDVNKEPLIHIVTPRDDPPLSQQLPLPPVDHKYSNRRALLLDAPYNPRRSRSPSPERRPYIARDYRGDRGRRRHLGMRNIKTK